MRKLLILPLAAAALMPAADASAAQKRCNQTHGTELAHSKVVKVYKVKTGSSFRFYGCAKPKGPVVALTQTFKGNDVKLVAAKGAFVAFTRTIGKQDTIAVVDARTGKKRHGLYPPYNIEFDVDPDTPQIGAARINEQGDLVVSYIGLGDGSSTADTVYIYAFDDSTGYDEGQLLDSGSSAQLQAKSIKLTGDDVTWTHGGKARSATIGQVPLSIVPDGAGTKEGDVTASGGISCHLTKDAFSGNCVGSFDSGDTVTITAKGPAGSTVTLSGGCSASQTQTATCDVKLTKATTVKVKFT